MARTESTMLELGTIAPDFALTDAVTGKTVRRDDFRGKEALLVLFICAHCPYVKTSKNLWASSEQITQAKPLAIVAISSNDANTHPADGPADMKHRPKTTMLCFPICRTNPGRARAYKRRVRPILTCSTRNSSWFIAGSMTTAVRQRRSGDGKDLRRRSMRACGQAGASGAEAFDRLQHQVEVLKRLPLDVAADGRLLVRGDRLACKHGIDRRTQIFSGHGYSITRTAVIVLAAIDELEVRVEEIRIGRARSVVRLRHGLRFVVEIRKLEADVFEPVASDRQGCRPDAKSHRWS